MSKFVGRRSITTGTGDGYSDHGLLTGLLDDDHPQYLITTAVRAENSPTSGVTKTDNTPGDVFSLTNAGTGASLFIQQTGTTSDADAALDIDNSGNAGRGLSVISDTLNPDLPLVQLSALSPSFDEPVLLIAHANLEGLALEVRGDGYISNQLEVGNGLILSCLGSNPFNLGDSGLYIKGEPGEFYFVDKDGLERTFTVASDGTADGYDVSAGCGINVGVVDGYQQISVDLDDIAGEGLVIIPKGTGCNELVVSIDAYQVGFDDTNVTILKGDDVQEVLEIIDGYLQGTGKVEVIHKYGSQAEDPDARSIFSTDGYEFPIGEDRLLVSINGLMQVSPLHYVESSTTTITFSDPLDWDDEVIICILPGSLGSGVTGTTDLQGAYSNSLSGAKTIILDDGQLNLVQTLATGSALRLTSNSSITTALDIIQDGNGEGARVKNVVESSPVMLLQKDAVTRNTVINTFVVERTTSHISGGQNGIGSAFMTRLESSGGSQFIASRIVTGTEDVTDSAESTYLAFEVSDDGVVVEHARLDSNGKLGINTNSPTSQLHVDGDGYFSSEVEVYDKARIGTGALVAPLNIPIFTTDPSPLENGDVWVIDNVGIRELKVRIAGSIYTTVLT